MEQRTCKNCKSPFEVTDFDQTFYEKMKIPAPTWCTLCRRMRRLSWRNENSLYQNECGLCKRKLISVYSPDKPYTVYCNKCWWSDKWDPKQYSQEFDFNKPFFEQFIEFHQRIPQLAIQNDDTIGSENCEYCQDFSNGKNCYLVTGTWYTRESLYSNNCNHVRDVVDCKSINLNCEIVYESVHCRNLYNCAFLQTCDNCTNCRFGIDLIGCTDCFGCIGLRHKKYYILNKPYEKEEYFKALESFGTGSYKHLEQLKKDFRSFALGFPRKAVCTINCEDCVGDNLFHCKDTWGFDVGNSQYCRYLDNGDDPKNCFDVWQSGNPQWCCECVTPDNSYETHYCVWCWKDKNVLYSDNCHSSGDLFGCIGLKHAKHCIFNKQYSKEEYEELKSRIIEHMRKTGEWGEFFPIDKSPFAYNETLVQDHFPITKEEALSKGFKWKEKDKREYQPQKYVIPDHINDVPLEITNEFLACTNCGKNYKITPLEISFYKKFEFPVPRKCPDCRRKDRQLLYNPMQLWDRNCNNCGKKIKSSFAPERPEIVYCEECYSKAIY